MCTDIKHICVHLYLLTSAHARTHARRTST